MRIMVVVDGGAVTAVYCDPVKTIVNVDILDHDLLTTQEGKSSEECDRIEAHEAAGLTKVY